jgi:hypothetical protein
MITPLLFDISPTYAGFGMATITSQACKIYYLINNHSIKLGAFTMVPAKTKYGNDSRTKKVPAFMQGIPLCYKKCECNQCTGSSSPADILIRYNEKEFCVPMLAVHYLIHHYGDVPDAIMKKINDIKINDDNYNETEIKNKIFDLQSTDPQMMYAMNSDRYFAHVRGKIDDA